MKKMRDFKPHGKHKSINDLSFGPMGHKIENHPLFSKNNSGRTDQYKANFHPA